ncbi:MAG TPA: STAS domain-containing protein [Acidimicrobiales bacterium]|nr:STAS domain-containing protein [Acidimicrobiales bacterium]
MELLTVEVEDRSDPVIVRVRGEADIATAADLADGLSVVGAKRPALVVLELSELAFIDCSGVDAILGARHSLAEAGSDLVLRCPTPAVARVLDLLSVDYVTS